MNQIQNNIQGPIFPGGGPIMPGGWDAKSYNLGPGVINWNIPIAPELITMYPSFWD